ncbi:MAG: hypothetical protein Q9207_005451 [Kuettlingeria erythrocarpa]
MVSKLEPTDSRQRTSEISGKGPSSETHSHSPGFIAPTSDPSSNEPPPNDPVRSTSSQSGLSKTEIDRLLTDDSYDPKLPTTHADFKQFIVDNVGRTSDIHHALESHQLSPTDIPVVVHKGKTYSLRTSTGALDHMQQIPDEDETDLETYFCQIRYADEEDCKSHYSSSGAGKRKEEADSFLPLGHLIEPDEDDESGRLTNYVWALNISTHPWSLWLIFDYLSDDDYEDDCSISLGELYRNPRNARKHYQRTVASSPFLGPKDNWDMLKVLNDIHNWNPEDPCPFPASDSHPPQHTRLGPSLRVFTLMDPFQTDAKK